MAHKGRLAAEFPALLNMPISPRAFAAILIASPCIEGERRCVGWARGCSRIAGICRGISRGLCRGFDRLQAARLAALFGHRQPLHGNSAQRPKTEYDFLGSANVSCAAALFPQAATAPAGISAATPTNGRIWARRSTRIEIAPL